MKFMTSLQKFNQAFKSLPLVAILRGLTFKEAIPIGQVLVNSGWTLIEVPLNSPHALDSIAALANTFEQVLVGAGTVLTPADVRNVHAAGGGLVVSPNFDVDVVRTATGLGMVCLPGVMTATEAFAALKAGATGLKLFPAEMVPPAGAAALRAVLPAATLLLPVGGIKPDNMQSYLNAGANGFGIGSALYKPGKTAEDVRLSAIEFIAACANYFEAGGLNDA